MLSDETITAIADELARRRRDRTTVPLLTARYPDMTVEDSYAVQNEWRRRGIGAGRRLVGRKIGLTSARSCRRPPASPSPTTARSSTTWSSTTVR